LRLCADNLRGNFLRLPLPADERLLAVRQVPHLRSRRAAGGAGQGPGCRDQSEGTARRGVSHRVPPSSFDREPRAAACLAGGVFVASGVDITPQHDIPRSTCGLGVRRFAGGHFPLSGVVAPGAVRGRELVQRRSSGHMHAVRHNNNYNNNHYNNHNNNNDNDNDNDNDTDTDNDYDYDYSYDYY